MKKIVLKESELIKLIESIVKEHNQGLLNEQKYAFIKHFIGNSVDDLVKKFGDDGAQKIEAVLAKGLGNAKNFVSRGGKTFILSKSGTEVPVETINVALKAVADGKYTMEEIVQYFPRQLADGTEFRSVFSTVKPKSQVPVSVGSTAAKSSVLPFTFILETAFQLVKASFMPKLSWPLLPVMLISCLGSCSNER